MKKVIIFDLFGTLLNINYVHSKITKQQKEDLLRGKISSKSIGVNKILSNQKKQIWAFRESFKVLVNLSHKGYDLYCISNLSEDFMSCFYDFKIHIICQPIFSCKTGLIKPEPSIYQKILNKYSEDKNVTFYMVGDSLRNDYLAPRKLGIKSYWLNRTNKKNIEKIPNNHIVSDLWGFVEKVN